MHTHMQMHMQIQTHTRTRRPRTNTTNTTTTISSITTTATQHAFQAKHFVCTGLKGMNAEQQARALQVAAKYKRKFEGGEWKGVMVRMRKSVRDGCRDTPKNSLASTTSTGRPLPKSSAKLTSPPRTRWDILPPGAPPPLSQTPTYNAFTPTGFWSSLTRTPTPITKPNPHTPQTAIHHPPVIPRDTRSNATYHALLADVEHLARGACAQRLGFSARTGSDRIFRTAIVSAEDRVRGAERALEGCRAPGVQEDVMVRWGEIVEQEDRAVRRWERGCFGRAKGKNEEVVEEELPQAKFRRGGIITGADSRARALEGSRVGMGGLLKLPQGALRVVWATRILEDMLRLAEEERLAEAEGDDEDEGYEYGNFVRSIRREASLAETVRSESTSETATERGSVDGDVRLSGTTYTSTTRHSQYYPHHHHYSQQEATPEPRNTRNDLPLRSIHSSHSSLTHHRSTSTDTIKTSIYIPEHNDNTDDGAEITPGPSPEEKGFRHRAPGFSQLSSWAHSLRETRSTSPSPSPSRTARQGNENEQGDEHEHRQEETEQQHVKQEVGNPTEQGSPPLSPWSLARSKTRITPTAFLFRRAIPLPGSEGVGVPRSSVTVSSVWSSSSSEDEEEVVDMDEDGNVDEDEDVDGSVSAHPLIPASASFSASASAFTSSSASPSPSPPPFRLFPATPSTSASASIPSLHNTPRTSSSGEQHRRSTSSTRTRILRPASRESEEEWASVLSGMEERERERRVCEGRAWGERVRGRDLEGGGGR
ncbi:hypothetical protein P153DRAFT_386493 [Dothidotthia symphoricarpi CBS 119687]|uniref:Uncharacterized protein n=1 Tax=Dothidotthia symphoricarpi CBS 119687 TaxID=1392245 RepID=A0A6A6A8T8_9PLEO|nr:uncharacterized protein P153DRAFT_386493 [Dothidotthia symphoricarpi CBS 119687]KAF2128372.1 hypothetical protein P153DRAFT_386493 [Dothidotthia symphoricarpi CBS 119687]